MKIFCLRPFVNPGPVYHLANIFLHLITFALHLSIYTPFRYKIPERDTISFIYDCQNNKCRNTDQTICSVIRGQCQGIGPVSPPPTKSYFKILGYQSTYIIKNLGYQGSQSSKAGSFSNLLAKRFVSWHFPPKFGEHIIIELESEDSRWTFCSHPP